MTATTTSHADIDALAARVRGAVVRPGDAEYDGARRVWNAGVDRRPAVIVRAVDAQDVIQALSFARAAALPLAVRGGGHSLAGHGTVDGGVVIDLRRLTRLAIDAPRATAWVDAGLTWRELNAQAHAEGLATPGPDLAAVGVAGLTLGGGFGLLSRRYGMTIDNLLAAELVTADGRLLVASPEAEPDLFWALRGGGGNFGVVTRLELRLHPVTTVSGGAIVVPLARETLRAYRDVAPALLEDVSTFAVALRAPPLPFIPAAAHGTPVLMILVCDAGDVAGSEHRLAPLRRLDGRAPLADVVRPLPYPSLLDLTEANGVSRPQSVRAGFVAELPDAALAAIVRAIEQGSSPFSSVLVRPLGGAMARVPADATAFSHRAAPFYLAISNAWDDTGDADAARHVAWTEQLYLVLASAMTGAYANFLGDEGAARVESAYAPATFARLREIKRRYDPENVFRANANIPPG